MQIDTWNRDEMDISRNGDVKFVPGPLPAASQVSDIITNIVNIYLYTTHTYTTYMHTCIHTHTYMHTHTHTPTHTHTHTHPHTHTYTRTHTQTHAHTQVWLF